MKKMRILLPIIFISFLCADAQDKIQSDTQNKAVKGIASAIGGTVGAVAAPVGAYKLYNYVKSLLSDATQEAHELAQKANISNSEISQEVSSYLAPAKRYLIENSAEFSEFSNLSKDLVKIAESSGFAIEDVAKGLLAAVTPGLAVGTVVAPVLLAQIASYLADKAYGSLALPSATQADTQEAIELAQRVQALLAELKSQQQVDR
jgi:hypothetical protein